MPSSVQLRDDYDAAALRELAKRSRDPRQIRRLLALAAVYDGMSRADAAKVGARAHAVVLMDRAGRYRTDKLTVPKNLTIILLPPRSPELNPVENIWQYLRQNWLSNRVFEDYDAILDAGCDAWNRLISQPQTIMSIGMRPCAHAGQ